jgi:pimeloyl-ACP methyl ester carboxylesterase
VRGVETDRGRDTELFERPGSGPAVVLLHGIGSQAGSFSPVLPELAPDLRVIAWNAPGYGASRPLAESWPEANDYARALAVLFDGLVLETATIVGHSLGALMGAAFATRHRDRVSRLVWPRRRSAMACRAAAC